MNKPHLSLITLAVCLSTTFMAFNVSAQASGHGTETSAHSMPLLDLGAELKTTKGHSSTGNAHTPSTQSSHGSSSKAQPTPKANHKAEHKVHWGYSGAEGPSHWGDLTPKNITCKIGKNQSPIDLRDKSAVGTTGLPALDIHYRDVPLKVINNGHTVQVNYPLGSYIKVGGHRYELLQFHFHTPSEHKKEGFNYPMEVHLVHSDGDGNLAVLGVIFQEGANNSALDLLLKKLPKDVGKLHIHKGAGLNPARFIPGNTEFYKYSGSLTTPPCSEGVYWMVFKHPIEASAEQIQQMNELIGENARPTQPINSRAQLKSWAEQLQEPAMYEFY